MPLLTPLAFVFLVCSFTLNGGNRFSNATDVGTWLGSISGLSGGSLTSGSVALVTMRLDLNNGILYASVNGNVLEKVSTTLLKGTVYYPLVAKHGGTPNTTIRLKTFRPISQAEVTAKVPVTASTTTVSGGFSGFHTAA